MTVSAADMYSSASRQLLYLGLGRVTFVPLLALLAGVASAGAAVLGVRAANEPYFVNPVPERIRLRAVAAVLIAASLACMLLPAVTVSFTQPGKNKVQATAEIGGLDAVTFSAPAKLADPVTPKGKPVYADEDEEYSRGAVNAATAGVATTYTWLTWAGLILTAAALAALLLKANKKVVIVLLLAAAALRTASWLCLTRGLPRAVATGTETVWLLVSLPLLIFGAFFAGFADREELPKKYKLFLMMLPFLLAVFLFSYLPLYGWSYAFFNYKFGLPIRSRAEEDGFDVLLLSRVKRNGRMDYTETALSRRMDGIIVIYADVESENVRKLTRGNIPVVSVDVYEGHTSTVLSDYRAGTRMLTEYAISRGHRRVALIHGEMGYATAERLEGFRSVMAEHGLELPPEYVRAAAFNNPEICARETERLLAMPEPPTCILMPDDYSVINALRILWEKGIRAPEDFSCAGYDGIPMSQMITPKLTTFWQDTESIGRTAVDTLLKVIQEGPGANRDVTVSGRLISGGTIADLRGRGSR